MWRAGVLDGVVADHLDSGRRRSPQALGLDVALGLEKFLTGGCAPGPAQ